MAKDTHNHTTEFQSTVAKTDDGSVQITFLIPQSEIDHNEAHALADLAKTTTIAGFRKGKAPVEKIKAATDADKLVEKTLMRILPAAFASAINQHKIKPATMPKFEVLSKDDPWQIRATTCEIADFELNDYKKQVKDVLSADSLWTPEKGDPKDKREPSKDEKEHKAMQTLLDSTQITIPKVLIEEEVNMRLAQLLDRIEKLGLTLEGYLSSVGKNPQLLRDEYERQTIDSIKLELILNKIAELERININEEEIDQTIAASGLPDKAKSDPSQKRAVASILRRRRVLDSLLS